MEARMMRRVHFLDWLQRSATASGPLLLTFPFTAAASDIVAVSGNDLLYRILISGVILRYLRVAILVGTAIAIAYQLTIRRAQLRTIAPILFCSIILLLATQIGLWMLP
jgi:hypothetical protein